MDTRIKVFIPEILRANEPRYLTINSHVAFTGFSELGCLIEYFNAGWEIQNLKKEDIVAGFMGDVKKALKRLELPIPDPIDYPSELKEFLGRKIWSSSLYSILKEPQSWNIFIKPAKNVKEFVGFALKSKEDLVGRNLPEKDTWIWCSELMDFESEWRCFVCYGEILDLRRYKGRWDLMPDPEVIQNAVKKYKNSPKAYSLDFGISSGNTFLVEANDGFALAPYGLAAKDYARFLSARWSELTHTKDPFLK